MIQTEKAVLAAVIQDNSLLPILLSNADNSLFSYSDNEIVFREIEKLHQEGQFFDLVILTDKLSGKIQAPFTYLCSVMECLTHSNIKFLLGDLKLYLNTLKRERAKEKLVVQMNKLTNEGIFDLDEAKRIISESEIIGAETETGSIEDCFKELDEISGKNKGINLGFPTLDRSIGSLRYGEVLLFMARTTVGKTFWALNVAWHLASHTQEKIAIFSLEMPKVSILERMIQIIYSLGREEALEKLKTDKKIKPQIEDKLRNIKIYTQSYSVNEVELKIREEGIKIAFIDFLDLLEGEYSRDKSRYEKTSDLIIEVKRMAKRQDALLIPLHQLSRGAIDGSIPVRLTMARDSGVVEEVSDFIIGAWRPEIGYDNKAKIPEDMKNRMFLGLLKNKRGPTKTIVNFFDHGETGTGKIREIEWKGNHIEE